MSDEPCSYCLSRSPVGVTDDNDSICEECAEPEYPEALVETLHAAFSKAYYSRVPIITRADADAAQRAGLVAALDALGLRVEWGTRYEAHVGYDIDEPADEEWIAHELVEASPTDTGLIRRYRTDWEEA